MSGNEFWTLGTGTARSAHSQILGTGTAYLIFVIFLYANIILRHANCMQNVQEEAKAETETVVNAIF